MKNVVVGLVGFARAGKGEVANILVNEFGFTQIKPSMVIYDALVQRYGECSFTREQYRAMREELKALRGPGYYLDKVDFIGRVLIDGPRHLSTTRLVTNKGGFNLGIVAKEQVRYQRALHANDEKPVPQSLEAFRIDELPDMNSINGSGGQLLPMLWEIDPQDIIDSTELSLEGLRMHVHETMSRRNIIPVQNLQD